VQILNDFAGVVQRLEVNMGTDPPVGRQQVRIRHSELAQSVS
jgi:hypothetical protein